VSQSRTKKPSIHHEQLVHRQGSSDRSVQAPDEELKELETMIEEDVRFQDYLRKEKRMLPCFSGIVETFDVMAVELIAMVGSVIVSRICTRGSRITVSLQ
jgi:hypothetical protein